ncbi:MAG: class I SAM-dependent methyltransferase [Thermoanaerobaculia bacterium]
MIRWRGRGDSSSAATVVRTRRGSASSKATSTPAAQRTFDEIICFEVLEHLRRDREVVDQFFRILRPGGALHDLLPQPTSSADFQVEILDSEGARRTCPRRIHS